MSIEELELSVRTHNCLDAAGITTVHQLAKVTCSELLKRKNFGRRSLTELLNALMPLETRLSCGCPRGCQPRPCKRLAAPVSLADLDRELKEVIHRQVRTNCERVIQAYTNDRLLEIDQLVRDAIERLVSGFDAKAIVTQTLRQATERGLQKIIEEAVRQVFDRDELVRSTIGACMKAAVRSRLNKVLADMEEAPQEGA